jgi:hypothetical protein
MLNVYILVDPSKGVPVDPRGYTIAPFDALLRWHRAGFAATQRCTRQGRG